MSIEVRPYDVQGRSNFNVYPAILAPAHGTGPSLVLSDDDRSTYAAFNEDTTDGKISAANAYFHGLPTAPASVQVSLYVLGNTSGVRIQVYISNMDDTATYFLANDIPTPANTEEGWYSTPVWTAANQFQGSIDDLLSDFYVGVNNQTHSGTVSEFSTDFFLFELKLIVDGAVGGRVPPIRLLQRSDGLGFSSAPRALSRSSIQGSLRNTSYL